MANEDLRERTIRFSLDGLPRSTKGRNIADQLCRSGTSVAANYRAACRSKSRADFVHKLGIVEEETDEVLFWLELIVRAGMLPASRLQPLMAEANELLSIVIASINTARRRPRN